MDELSRGWCRKFGVLTLLISEALLDGWMRIKIEVVKKASLMSITGQQRPKSSH